MVWVKLPVLKSAPITVFRVMLRLLYTWKLSGKKVASVEFLL